MRTWTLQSTRANLGVIVTLMREGDDPRSVTAAAGGDRLRQGVRRPRPRLEPAAARLPHRPGRLRRHDPRAAARSDRRPRPPGRGDGLLQRLDLRLDRGDRAPADRRLHGGARAVGARRGRDPRGRGAGAARRRRRSTRRRSACRLGYELDRYHVGFVVWSEDGGRAPGRRRRPLRARWSSVAAAVAESLGAARAADRRRGSTPRLLGGAAERPRPGAPAAPTRRRPAASRSPPGRPRTASRASSSATARRCWPAGSPSCAATAPARVAYPDVSLEALLADDLDAARRFAERELGPLAADDDATVRLASTLAIFLEEGASFVRAARRLGVHANTVAYRVRRAEACSAARSPSASSSSASP